MNKRTIIELLENAALRLFRNYLKWVLILLSAFYVFSGFYNVDRDSAGILIRFGKIIPSEIQPGLHYKIPWPVDKVVILPVKEIRTLVVDDFTLSSGKPGRKGWDFYKVTGLAPYFITGDNNILSMKMTIKYTISDPVNYIVNNISPETLLEESAAESIVKHVSKTPVDDILTIGKKQLEMTVKKEIASMMENYKAGLSLVFIEIQEINPPKEIQPYFDKVINAKVEKKQTVNDAQSYYNRIVPDARTKADITIQSARSYKNSIILEAQGKSHAFIARFDEIKKDRKTNRKKIYISFLKRLFPKLQELRIVDKSGQQAKSDKKIILQTE